MKLLDEGNAEDREKLDEGISYTNKISNKEMAKKVVIELTSLIPKDAIEEQIDWKKERWNCGMHCEGFVPSSETDGQNHLCKRRNSNRVIDDKKRCDFIKVKDELKVVPDWVEEEFNSDLVIDDEDIEVPKKPKKHKNRVGAI